MSISRIFFYVVAQTPNLFASIVIAYCRLNGLVCDITKSTFLTGNGSTSFVIATFLINCSAFLNK